MDLLVWSLNSSVRAPSGRKREASPCGSLASEEYMEKSLSKSSSGIGELSTRIAQSKGSLKVAGRENQIWFSAMFASELGVSDWYLYRRAGTVTDPPSGA